MKVEGKIFAFGTIFFVLISAIYWYVSRDPIGTTALALTGGLAFLVGFYLLFTARRVGTRPEDDPLSDEVRHLRRSRARRA